MRQHHVIGHEKHQPRNGILPRFESWAWHSGALTELPANRFEGVISQWAPRSSTYPLRALATCAPTQTPDPKENTMFDPSLISVAIHAALDVCWPILHPELIKELAYV